MNWIYIIGTISIISGIKNAAKRRTQNNIAAGIATTQEQMQQQQWGD